MSEKSSLLIVTGLSGAGMSSALNALQDMGYEVFDNFPLSLVTALTDDPQSSGKPVALGIDTRARGFNQKDVLDLAQKEKAKLIFMTADQSELLRRFSETRRVHPMAKDRAVSDGIKLEEELTFELKQKADLVIDTSELSVKDLNRVLDSHFRRDRSGQLSVSLMSFGFKYGPPREADNIFDVRFLHNPHYDDALRPMTGRDQKVQDFIKQDEGFSDWFEALQKLLSAQLAGYAREGRTHVTIAFGCTGGRHRSVYNAEKVKPWIEDQGFAVHLFHRDIER